MCSDVSVLYRRGQSALQQQQQAAQLKQQLEILASAPFGDEALFRNAFYVSASACVLLWPSLCGGGGLLNHLCQGRRRQGGDSVFGILLF